jgi:hypothetical protein
VPFNGIGWNSPGDCRVEASTTFYMTKPGCLAIEGSPLSSDIRVKYGTSLLIRRSPALFCPDATYRRNPTGIEIVSVAWAPPDAATVEAHPFFLESIRSLMDH